MEGGGMKKKGDGIKSAPNGRSGDPLPP